MFQLHETRKDISVQFLEIAIVFFCAIYYSCELNELFTHSEKLIRLRQRDLTVI